MFYKPGRDGAGRGTEQEASRWKPEGEDFLPIFSIWKNILNFMPKNTKVTKGFF